MKKDERITAVNHKGGRCVYPDGPQICQEGDCGGCAIHKRRFG